MRTIAVIFLFSLVAIPCLSYTLEGQVFDTEGKPISDVLVVIIDNRRNEFGRDYSDSMGKYRITGLPKGTFLLEVTKFGYPKQSTTIRISGVSRQSSINHDIHLKKTSFQKSLKKGELSHLYLQDDVKIPVRALVLFKKGKKYFMKGKYKKAKKKFDKALQIFPNFSRAYYYLGLISMKNQGFTDLTQRYFKKAIETNPSDPAPHVSFGEYYLQEKDYPHAEKHLRAAIQLDQELGKPHFLLGTALYFQGKFDEAEFELSRGMLRQPQLGKQYRITLANVYIKLNRLSDAKDQLQLFLKENPYSPQKQEIEKRIREIENAIAVYILPDME